MNDVIRNVLFCESDGKQMMLVSEKNYSVNVFEIVDEVPRGYMVWNIGNHMPDGYLPLCKLKAQQAIPGGCEIENDTLKAIKIDGSEKIMKVANAGINTLKKMEAYVSRNPKPRNYYRKYVDEALEIAKRIKWNE